MELLNKILNNLLIYSEFLNSSEHFIWNIIFYIILTIALIYYWIKMNYYEEKLRKIDDKFSSFISKTLKLKKESGKLFIKKTVRAIEMIITTLFIVVLIQSFYLGHFFIPTGSMEKTIMPGDRIFANMVIYKFRKPKREEIITFKEPIQDNDRYTKRLMGLPGETVNIKDGYLYVNGEKIETRKYSSLGRLGNKSWIIPKKGDKIEIVPQTNFDEVYKKHNLDVGAIQENLVYSLVSDNIIPNLIFKLNGVETGPLLEMLHEKKIVDQLMDGKKVEIILERDYYLALGDNTNNSFDSRMWGFVKEDRIFGKGLVKVWPIREIGLLK